MQKEVHLALVVRAMRVGCSVTAILSRRRSILQLAILASSGVSFFNGHM